MEQQKQTTDLHEKRTIENRPCFAWEMEQPDVKTKHLLTVVLHPLPIPNPQKNNKPQLILNCKIKFVEEADFYVRCNQSLSTIIPCVMWN